MKKILFTLGLLAVFVVSAQAQLQRHVVQSFLNARSIGVSNTFGVTNLSSLLTQGSVGPGTNKWGTFFTNYQGTFSYATNNATLTNTPGTYENYNLVSDVWLWEPATHTPVATNSLYSILIKVVGAGALSTNTVNFSFIPLPDGTNEVTSSGEVFNVGLLPNGTTPVVIVTNVPSRFVGSAKLRLRSVTSLNVDASSRVDVLNCSLVGFPSVQP